MKRSARTSPRTADGRTSGPQGTRLFSAEELRRHAREDAHESDGRASVREPVLEGISEGLEGRRFSLRSGRQTIGRSSDNDILVDDPSVSASHAWILNQQGHYVVMNTLSTNGTFVNGERVHEAALKHGDRVRLGQAEFAFLTREHGAPRPVRPFFVMLGVLALIALGFLLWWQF